MAGQNDVFFSFRYKAVCHRNGLKHQTVYYMNIFKILPKHRRKNYEQDIQKQEMFVFSRICQHVEVAFPGS